MFSWIGNILKIAASACGWGQQRSADKNTPEMKANASAAMDQATKDAAAKAIADQDDEAIKRGLAQ